MDSSEKQVRVFISSTFRDMHVERDHLVTVVFPELRERVEQLGLEFFDVDLRWGVPAKDANGETANSWEYCRQWIDRVEPFFVCILGQRYGWVPGGKDFKDEADQSRQEKEPRSITDLEVRHAVLTSQRKRRSYFYLRATDAPADASEYVDPPPLLDKLVELKNEVRACGRPVRDYPCKWSGSGFTGMEVFGHQVLEDLWSGVLRDERYVSKEVWRQALETDPDGNAHYTDESQTVPRELWEKILKLAKPPQKDPLDAEREQMDRFAASRLRWFQGRTHELQQLTDFINSTDETAPRLAVVAAVPGQGKSALLAKLSSLLIHNSSLVISHFVGATERSTTAHALVERLLGELDRSGIEWPTDEQKEDEEPKRDFNSLCRRLSNRLGEYAGEKRMVILLDALNQLTDGHDLIWLPHRLGPSVHMVVSCVEDKAAKADSSEQRILHAFFLRQPAPLRVQLGPLTESDVRAIVVDYLKEYCKELDREHVDAICRMDQAKNSLYLLVMLSELRTLGGNDMNRIVGERIVALAHDYPDTVCLFRWVLQRLEVFGSEAVRWWCLYLAHGRVGMASDELADLLARKHGADATATALLIERGLRRYLLRRGAQLDYFHGQLRQAVVERYGSERRNLTGPVTSLHFGICVHRDMAEYFKADANWTCDTDGAALLVRRLSETPYHMIRARLWQEIYETLTSLDFLEGKSQHVSVTLDINGTRRYDGIFDVLEDYRSALTSWSRVDSAEEKSQNQVPDVEFLQLLFRLMQSEHHTWMDDPCRIFPQLYAHLRAAGKHGNSTAQQWLDRYLQSMTRKGPWLRQLSAPVSRSTKLSIPMDGKLGRTLVFSWDGQILYGSAAGSLCAWSTDSGKSLLRHNCDSEVIFMEPAPDGQDIMALTRDGRLFRINTAAVLQELPGPAITLARVASGNCSRMLALGSRLGHVYLWSIAENNWIARDLRGWTPIRTMSFDRPGKRLLVVRETAHCTLYDSSRLQPLTEVFLPVLMSCALPAVDDDGWYLGGIDGSIQQWDPVHGMFNRLPEAGNKPITVMLHVDGLFFAADTEGMVRCWQIDQWSFQGTVYESQSPIVALACSKGMLATAQSMHLIEIACLTPAIHSQPPLEIVTPPSWLPDGTAAVAGSRNREIVITSNPEVDAKRVDENEIFRGTAAMALLKPVWAVGTSHPCVTIYDLTTFTKTPVSGISTEVTCLAVHPTGDFVVTGHSGGNAGFWDGLTGGELGRLPLHDGGVTALCLTHDASYLISGGEDGRVVLWELWTEESPMCDWGVVILQDDKKGRTSLPRIRHKQRECRFIVDKQKHPRPITAMALSPNGTFLVVASNLTLTLLSVPEMKAISTLPTVDSPIRHLSISPDGDCLAGMCSNGCCQIWSISRGSSLCQLRFAGPGLGCAWRPDGNALAISAGGALSWLHLEGHTGG